MARLLSPRRGIDHLVLAVDDLSEARDRFTDIGFLTTPLGKHPWGTGNHLVQFPRNFIELLGVIDASALVPMSDDHFSFGAFNDRFLRRRQGMSMLVLSTEDARADAEDWRGRGLHVYEPFHWSRNATLPDGSETTVAFTLTFVTHPLMAETAFFSCQQHNPGMFWKPEYQTHENGAKRIAGVTLVAEDPGRHGAFVADLIGDADPRGEKDDVLVETANGAVRIQSPERFAARFPAAGPMGDTGGGALMAAAVAVDDPDHAAACLERHGIPCARGDGSIYLTPDHACGMVLEFVKG
jgi:hypothetical protein